MCLYSTINKTGIEHPVLWYMTHFKELIYPVTISFVQLTNAQHYSQLVLGGVEKIRLGRAFGETYDSGLYFLYGDNSGSYRYALIYVCHRDSGYDVVPIGNTNDFGNTPTSNLIYEINEDGVRFRTGSGLPCYLKKLM